MFDMMHTPNSREAGTRGSGIRKAALAAAASLTMAFGAAATAPMAAAVPEPPARDVTGKCDENLPPADPHAAIEQAIAEGHISPNHDWQPNKAMPYLEGPCHLPTAQPISARGGDPTAPTAVLLYYPGQGGYATTAEIPSFAAEGPAWGDYTSGMVHIARTAPYDITVWWRNAAGEHATMRYMLDDGVFQPMFLEGSTP